MTRKVPKESLSLEEIVQYFDQQHANEQSKLLAKLKSLWAKSTTIDEKVVLIAIGFASEEQYRQILNEHPAAHQDAEVGNVHRAFEILEASRNAIVDIVGRLHGRLTHLDFSAINRGETLRDATKELYTYSCAALSLVQAYRHLFRDGTRYCLRYDKFRKETIGDSKVVDFIRDVRSSNNHIHILEARPNYSVTTSFKDGTKEVSSDLLFNPQTILKSPTFGKTSKAFVASQKELSVLEVINSHFKIASSLHEKFMSRTGLHSDPQLRELARIRVARKSMSYRHTLGLILQVAVTQKLNPYEYLHRWFSKEELERAYSLPDHSKE